MKKTYKELQKKLKNEFTRQQGDYRVVHSVGKWFKQCGIKPTSEHLNIIYTIFGSVPYPFQENDRKVILKYLKKHKYKEFKGERLT